MQQVSFVLYSSTHQRNFIDSGVIPKLLQINGNIFHVEIYSQLPTKGIRSNLIAKPPRVFRYILTCLELAYLWKFRARSFNHQMRAHLTLGSTKGLSDWSCVAIEPLQIGWLRRSFCRTISHFPETILQMLFSSIARILSLTYWRGLFKGKDLVITPFPGHVGYEYDLILCCAKRYQIPVIALQENWDHIATKSFALFEPASLLVWGSQSKGHAVSIQGYFTASVRIAGSPRFNKISGNTSSAFIVSIDGHIKLLEDNYLLFVGSTRPDEDFLILSELINNFDSSKISIVYRIHPKMSKNYFEGHSTFADVWFDYGSSIYVQNQLESLVANSEFIINLLSTLSIEAAILGIPSCVPLFANTNSSRYGLTEILETWTHLQGVRLIDLIFFAQTKNDFISFSKMNYALLRDKRLSLDWFCRTDVDYVEQLIEEMVSQSSFIKA